MVQEALSTDISLNADYVDRAKLILIAFISNLGALLLGFDYGVTSYLLTEIDYFASSSSYSDFVYFKYVEDSSVLLGLLASGCAIGAAITYSLLIFYGNSISKKDEILLTSFLYFVGAMLESFSFYVSWKSVGGLLTLIIGRLIFGAGVATSFHSAPQYVAEMAPAEVRGNIGSATEVMVGCGVLLGYVLGFVSDEDDGWAQIYLIGYLIALIMGCLAMVIPHSPKWMARHNFASEEILESLQYLYPNATEESVTRLRKQVEVERAQSLRMEEVWKSKYELQHNKSWYAPIMLKLPPEVKFLFYDSILSRCLTYGLILVILNMATGHAAILYYAGDIFDDICENPDACIVGLGLAKLLPAILMTSIADIFGRRPLLLLGTGVVTFGLAIITSGYGANDDYVTVTGMYLAIIGWEIGFGTMIWFILNELFPYFVRPAGISISSLVLTLTSTIIIFILPSFKDWIGYFGCFLFFTLIGCSSFLLVYFFQPETRGIDLEQTYKLVNTNYTQTMNFFGYPLNEIDDEYDALLTHEEDIRTIDKDITPISI